MQTLSRHRSAAAAAAGLLMSLAFQVAPGCLTTSAKPVSETDRAHWAFQPIQRPEPPSVRAPAGASITNAVDRFIVARLQGNGLALAPPASKEQLLRRVTYDLIGLPPAPEEIDAFLKDSSPGAFEKIVDRLLASPHYGERWARHWLDLARFGESDGFEHDTMRPQAWRYRDYVVQAFNDDLPYDRFIREQLAGDEAYPENRDALIATGFNLLGPDMVDSADQIQRRHNTLNDMTDTAALVFLGQTIGCARCHQHKSEPFSQRDYYQLQAFFVPAEFRRDRPVPTPEERREFDRQMAEYQVAIEPQRKDIEAIEGPHRERLHAEKLARLSEEARTAHLTPKEKRTVEMVNQIQETAQLLEVTEAELLKAMSEEEKARRKALLQELKRIKPPAPLPLAMALQDKAGAGPKTFVLERGDYNNPLEEVQPGFPEIFGTRPAQTVPPEFAKPRLLLANWIASPDNPLTARVMVNRIWQHHFGRGLVSTPSDFGTRAARPTHLELLDWLASEFIAGGWRMKRIHKLILLSDAYQQSSQAPPEVRLRDPENKWFSRQNRVRLDAEAIRDSLLAISKRLNRQVGGPSVFPPLPADLAKGALAWNASSNRADHARRSLYISARRTLRYPFLELFDSPDNNLSCPERPRSTSAPQALTLLNSEEAMAAAEATAAAFLKSSAAGDSRIDAAFRLVIGRPPSGRERALARQFLERTVSPDEAREAPQEGAAASDFREFFRALFNLNAFVYVD